MTGIRRKGLSFGFTSLRRLLLVQVVGFSLAVPRGICTCAAAYHPSTYSQQLEDVLRHFSTTRPSQKQELLQPRHQREFQDSSLWNKFARAVCTANAVSRKELFESYATALLIIQHYSTLSNGIPDRIADLACGHGLLSWALLVLADAADGNNSDNHYDTSTPRSAVCIDQRMPKSADKIFHAVTAAGYWPSFSSRWDYVEGKLESIDINTSSTSSKSVPPLICGIHACSGLTDQILSLALIKNAPLALLPCCHSTKPLNEQDREAWNRSGGTVDLATWVDNRRVARLRNNGYCVEVDSHLPCALTPKNRLIMASPSAPTTAVLQQQLQDFKTHKHSHHMPSYTIPLLESDPESIATVRSFAGRRQATLRKQPPPPTMCVSVFFSTHQDWDEVLKQVKEMVVKVESTSVSVQVDYADVEAYWHSKAERWARTFQFKYQHTGLVGDVESDNAVVTKEQAKTCTQIIAKTIPEMFPGSRVR